MPFFFSLRFFALKEHGLDERVYISGRILSARIDAMARS
jgi:hypothetical protein